MQLCNLARTSASCSYERFQPNNQVLAPLSVSTCAFKFRHYRNQQINSFDEKSDTGVPDRYKHLNALVKRHTPTIPANIKKILCDQIEHSTIHKISKLYITKTRLYNFDPLKPYFYIVKLGFTGVYIIFLISAQKHRFWVLVRTASSRRF